MSRKQEEKRIGFWHTLLMVLGLETKDGVILWHGIIGSLFVLFLLICAILVGITWSEGDVLVSVKSQGALEKLYEANYFRVESVSVLGGEQDSPWGKQFVVSRFLVKGQIPMTFKWNRDNALQELNSILGEGEFAYVDGKQIDFNE